MQEILFRVVMNNIHIVVFMWINNRFQLIIELFRSFDDSLILLSIYQLVRLKFN